MPASDRSFRLRANRRYTAALASLLAVFWLWLAVEAHRVGGGDRARW